MFDSLARGFRMIVASMGMGWEDKRLLLPSILTVLTNIFFGAVIAALAANDFAHPKAQAGQVAQSSLFAHNAHPSITNLISGAGLNGPLDQSGFGAGMGSAVGDKLSGFDAHATMLLIGLMMLWWLTNRILEGITTALVYTHLTEGAGQARFGEAVIAVFTSLPAIAVLGIVTFIARRVAGWMRNRRGTGMMGFGINFLAGVIEIFWTLAGHLILPAIVIEGTSFWGALKRADRIAQGNLLTIGLGEVGVDLICKFTSFLVYVGGIAGFYYAYAQHIGFATPVFIAGAIAWALSVVFITALSIYIRSAFYTCLYVWALDAEAVQATERSQVKPPRPLAHALA